MVIPINNIFKRIMESKEHYLKKELYSLIKEDSSIFEFLQDGSLDGIWYWDLEDPEIEWMSSRFWTLFGYNPEEKLHLVSEWQDLINPEDLKVALQNFSKHCADPTHPYDQVVRYRHKDGSTVWVRCRGIAIRDKTGKPVRMLGAHTNLTPQKKIEKVLRDSEEKYKVLAENSADVIYKFNLETGKYTYVSPSITKLLGYTIEEGLALSAKDALSAESYIKQRSELIEDLTSSRFEPKIMELEAVHKNGHPLPVEIHAKFIFDEQGNPVEILGAVRDISERKRAEEELNRMAQEWQTTFDTTNDAIWVLDQESRIQHANKKAEELFHYTVREMIGKQCWEVAHGTEQPIPDCPNQLAKHSLSRETMDLQVGENWIKVTVDPILNKSGMYAGAVHIVTDITELRLSEENLRKSEKRFKFLAENMADIVWTLDMDLNASYVSPSIEKALGFTPEERKRQKLEKIVTADSFERIMALFLKELQHEEEQSTDPNRSALIDTEYYHRDGSIVWMENLVKIQRNQKGEMVGVYGASRNITERKKAQASMRESKKKYQDLYNKAPDMFGSVDAETGLIHQCNQTLANRLGYTRDEIVGRPIFDLYHPDCMEAVHATFRSFVETGEVHDAELQLMRKDGSKIEVSLNVSAVRDANGTILYSRSIWRDITKRKLSEDALRQAKLFLTIANRHRKMTPLLKDFVTEIKKITGCDAVGIRLLDNDGNMPFKAYEGFSKEFYESENSLHIYSDQCMCINVIKGETNGNLPFYTEGGSFHTNSTSDFFSTISEEEKGRTRNVCNQFGYESIALIPIRLGNRFLGLIHIADSRKGLISYLIIEMLESIAMQLAIAIQRVWAEEVLKKSHDRLEQSVEERTAELKNTNYLLRQGIKEHKQTQKSLQKKERELKQKTKNLEKANAALEVLLEHREEEKKKLAENIMANTKKLVLPYIEKMEGIVAVRENMTYLNIIKSNLAELISPFANTLSSKYYNFTPTEIQISDLIKQGQTSKEIASLLNVSPHTLSFHRYNIRKKLGILNKKINLRSYLESL